MLVVVGVGDGLVWDVGLFLMYWCFDLFKILIDVGLDGLFDVIGVVSFEGCNCVGMVVFDVWGVKMFVYDL